jgi:adenylate kinase family enzyme
MPTPEQVAARIVVVGTSGSGKTTTARRIAQILNIPHVELDALHWEPHWIEADLAIFRQRADEATRGESWTLDGNYSKVRDIVWPRATTILWLDYSFPLVMWRIITRTLRRSLTREQLWNGNRETVRGAVFGRDSIILWSLTTYHRRRREYPELFARPEHSHLTVIRQRSPKETERWLAELATKSRD